MLLLKPKWDTFLVALHQILKAEDSFINEMYKLTLLFLVR
jgi:hypothetical protein